MVELSHSVVKLTELVQVCIVVHDVDKSAERIWNVFGIGPWNIHTVPADSLRNVTYHGRPGRFGFRIARTQNKVGGMEMELIQPIEGNSIYHDFLREHGEGIHHLGWFRVESQEAFDKTARALESQGFPCMMSAHSPRGKFGYFDTTQVLNTILEVIWWDPSTNLLPDYTFPV